MIIMGCGPAIGFESDVMLGAWRVRGRGEEGMSGVGYVGLGGV